HNAIVRNQSGDQARQVGDLASAEREYAAGLAADPTSVALRRGQARVDAARGHLDAALTGYADVTGRAPTPSAFIEYAELLRTAGRTAEADAQLALAATAQRLFTDNGGVDGLSAAALAVA